MKKYLSTLFVLSLSILLVGCGNNESTTKEPSNYEDEPSQEVENMNTQTGQFYTDFDGNNMINLTFNSEYIKVEPDYLMEPQYDFYFVYLDEEGERLDLSLRFEDSYKTKEEFYNNFVHYHEDNYTNVKGGKIETQTINGIKFYSFKITYDWEGEGINKDTGKLEYMSGTSDSEYHFTILENGNFIVLNASNLSEAQYEHLIKNLFVKLEVVK